jgi:GxxExxY protein
MSSFHGSDGLTERIIWCLIRVHQTLGPGFLENVYRRALVIELGRQGLSCEVEKEVVVLYDGEEVGHHRIDVLVENEVLLELKAVESLARVHYAQLRSYMSASNIERGLLVNFSAEHADFRRVEARATAPPSPHHPRPGRSLIRRVRRRAGEDEPSGTIGRH